MRFFVCVAEKVMVRASVFQSAMLNQSTAVGKEPGAVNGW